MRKKPMLAYPVSDKPINYENKISMQPKLDGVWHKVPDGPGLGVEFNEELAKEQTFKFWEAPHLRRLDGSHTNW